jgi:hypothetical protein
MRLVHADHRAGDHGIPGDAVAARHVHHQCGGQHGEGHQRERLPQPPQGRREIGPGVQPVPGAPQRLAFGPAPVTQAELRQRLVQRAPVHVVHVEGRLQLADDALHRQPPPGVDEVMPVDLDAERRAQPARPRHQAAVPIEHGAAGVEGEGIDFRRRLQNCRVGFTRLKDFSCSLSYIPARRGCKKSAGPHVDG